MRPCSAKRMRIERKEANILVGRQSRSKNIKAAKARHFLEKLSSQFDWTVGIHVKVEKDDATKIQRRFKWYE